MGAETWREHAACRGMDPELFFPGRRDFAAVAAAQAVCAGCPVREDCLAEAVANCERFGIWGGKGEPARRRIRRDLGLASSRLRVASPACGTASGYAKHRRRGEAACDDCKAANSAAVAERAARARRRRLSA